MTAGSQPVPRRDSPRRVSVYIDGFNLYYGSLKGTPYKWLDPYAAYERLITHLVASQSKPAQT